MDMKNRAGFVASAITRSQACRFLLMAQSEGHTLLAKKQDAEWVSRLLQAATQHYVVLEFLGVNPNSSSHRAQLCILVISTTGENAGTQQCCAAV